ncbi:neurogenic locus notch homolog protein 4-like isoform X2 [Ornithodoros turicata]|uniref:neurogenic locus notch homolog protein 4-like isoform X2 n=1 Tax=Ornithodoros turicata TaxID=34597 RepID=UPI003138FB56
MTTLWRFATLLLPFLFWSSQCATIPEAQTPSTRSVSTSGIRRPPTMPGSVILLEPTSGTSQLQDDVTFSTSSALTSSEAAVQKEVTTTTDRPTSSAEVTSQVTSATQVNVTEVTRRAYSEACTKAVLEESWREWRTRPETLRFQLHRENVTCHLAGCRGTSTSKAAPEDIDPSKVISVVLQNQDSMELELDVPEVGNNRSWLHEAVLQSLQGAHDLPRGACVQDDSLLLWSRPLPEKDGAPLSLGPEILTPGLHLLSVHVVGPDVSCPAVWQLNVSVLDNECSKGPGEDLCSQKGSCVLPPGQASYTCRCCPGVGGRYCEERDGCFEKPCHNGGFCVDIAEGLSGNMFQCLCPHGFRGSSCEERVSPCDRRPCRNNGTCISNGTDGLSASCLCPPGFRGAQCEMAARPPPTTTQPSSSAPSTHHTNATPAVMTTPDTEITTSTARSTEAASTALPTVSGATATGTTKAKKGPSPCDARPCVHGMCEEEESETSTGGFKCYCLPGYGGDRCEFEYDECDSGPCANGGQCEDLVAAFRCHCGPGYTGKRCELKVDLCRPDPCPSPARCIDKGNNYSCICHPGFNSPGCTQHYDPCFPNPCQNGGSCWPSLDSFYCSCRGGFTGDACEDLVYPAPRPAMPRVGDAPGYRVPVPANKVSANVNGHGGSGPVDHLHNIYIAAATLAGACLIVVAVVTICHCRVHKTYQGFARKLGRSCAELKQHTLPRQILAEPSWERF